MRDYTTAEMDWEYNVEYLKYSFSRFPTAFASRDDFQKQYDAGTLRELTREELIRLGNSMAACGFGKDDKWLRATFSHRRDVDRIISQLRTGDCCPPIILESKGRLHLMAGQTRLAVAAALNYPILVNIISVK